MKILDIKHAATGETRTDGRYPLRIGSTVKFYVSPIVNNCAFLEYIADNQGNPKKGFLRTSIIQSLEEKEDKIILTTMNSIYILSKENN